MKTNGAKIKSVLIALSLVGFSLPLYAHESTHEKKQAWQQGSKEDGVQDKQNEQKLIKEKEEVGLNQLLEKKAQQKRNEEVKEEKAQNKLIKEKQNIIKEEVVKNKKLSETSHEMKRLVELTVKEAKKVQKENGLPNEYLGAVYSTLYLWQPLFDDVSNQNEQSFSAQCERLFSDYKTARTSQYIKDLNLRATFPLSQLESCANFTHIYKQMLQVTHKKSLSHLNQILIFNTALANLSQYNYVEALNIATMKDINKKVESDINRLKKSVHDNKADSVNLNQDAHLQNNQLQDKGQFSALDFAQEADKTILNDLALRVVNQKYFKNVEINQNSFANAKFMEKFAKAYAIGYCASFKWLEDNKDREKAYKESYLDAYKFNQYFNNQSAMKYVEKCQKK